MNEKIEKLKRLYKEYLSGRTGCAVYITQQLKNDKEIITFLNDKIKIECEIKQKFYMYVYDIYEIPLCQICGRQLNFNFKHGFISSGNDHRICNKKPYNKVYDNYNELFNIYDLKKISPLIFINRKKEIPKLLDKFLNDYPLFKFYSYQYLILLFSILKNENDISNIPVCKYCKLYKCSINERIFIKEQKIIFNEHCFNCRNKYGSEQLKISYKQKTGYDNPSQNPHVKEKKKKTNLKNCGYENPFQSKEIRKKHIETCQKKYNVDNISQIDFVKDKKEKTLLKNYGSYSNFVDQTLGSFCRKLSIQNISQLEYVKEKKKISAQKKYGVDNVFQSEEIKQKIKEFYQKNYGVDSYSQTFDGRQIARETCIEYAEKNFNNGFPLLPIIGNKETSCLNEIEEKLKVKIYRNVKCIGYYIDGYISSSNLCLEFDEPHHYCKGYNFSDIQRQKDICEYLHCNFFRIKEIDWELNKEQVINIIDFIISDKSKISNHLLLELKNNYMHLIKKERTD